jgi:hypothetical protein
LGKGYTNKPRPDRTTHEAKNLDAHEGPVIEAKDKAELLKSKPNKNHSFLAAGKTHLNQSR